MELRGRALFAAECCKPLGRKGPTRLAEPDAAADFQDRMGDGQLVGRRSRVHVRIVQHEILDMNEFAGHPKCCRRIEEMPALAVPVFDDMAVRALIEPRQGVFRRNHQRDQRWMVGIGRLVSHFENKRFLRMWNVTRESLPPQAGDAFSTG
jgi:hypothetical protein